jgi:multiple sugar transport system substrate-binding protein
VLEKSLVIGVGLFVLVGTFASIGDRVVSRQSRPDRVTVIYWEKWTGQEGEVMREIVNDFNQSQDKIFVKYLNISGIDQKTLLATSGGNPPDIAGLWQEQIFQFAEAGALLDLSEMANQAGLSRDFYVPTYFDSISGDGKLWALPSTPASIALYVRPDLLPPAVGTKETFPKTIEELDELVFRVSKKNPDGSMKFAGFLPSNPGWWNWSWSFYFGGEIFTDVAPTLNTEEGTEAYEWASGYSKKFGTQSVQNFQSGFGNFASPQDPFLTGKVAMELNGVWKANSIRTFNPDLKYFVVPFPHPKSRPDLAGHTLLQLDTLSIPKSAKNPKEAFEFIRYVQRQDVMEKLVMGHGKNSPLAKVSDQFFKNHLNPEIKLFDELARSKHGYFAPKSGFGPQVRGELNNAFQEVNAGVKPPKQALADAEKRVLSLWEKYQKQVLSQ